MAKEKKVILSIYFHGEDTDDFAQMEIQGDQKMIESIMTRLENANLDKLFRLTNDKLINLRSVKEIRYEETTEESLYDDEEETN